MTSINKVNYKVMKNAEVWVQVVVKELVNQEGVVVRREAIWQKLDKEVNLGSVKNPQNQKIVGIKVVSKNEPIDIKKFFGGFLGD